MSVVCSVIVLGVCFVNGNRDWVDVACVSCARGKRVLQYVFRIYVIWKVLWLNSIYLYLLYLYILNNLIIDSTLV